MSDQEATPSRASLLAPAVTVERHKGADLEASEYRRFCDRLRLPVSAEAVVLYLTWVSEDLDESGRAVRRRLARLDLAARLAGAPPWSSDDVVRRFLRGLHRERALGAGEARGEPLYAELVHVLVDALMRPTATQQRDRAAILLAAQTGLSSAALARIYWHQVRLRRDCAELSVPPPPGRQRWGPSVVTVEATGGALCPVLALRRLRAASGQLGPVFGSTGGVWDAAQVLRAVNHLAATGGDVAAAVAGVSVSPRQLRDRAVLLVGYGAALRTHETTSLTRADLVESDEGLLLQVAGRKEATAIPHDAGQPSDPVAAWQAWTREAQRQGHEHPGEPAFLVVSGSRIWRKPVNDQALNDIVQEACNLAGLSGHFVYTSLRAGLIRTALRADQQTHDIAAHTDLRSLGSVTRHLRREHLLSRSVAGQLGL